MTAAHESSETHLCAAQFALPSSPAVDFGVGALQRVPEHLSALGVSRAFLVTDRGLRSTGIVDQLLEALADHDLVIDTFDDVPANPTTDIAENAAARLRECGAGALIALGGGSSMDTAKGVALLATNPADRAGDVVTNPGLPLIAVPTTSGTGAETNGFGVLEDRVSQHKVYCGHDSVTPRVAVLDPALTVGLPVRPTAATGVDALVHGVESLTSRGRNPVSELYASRAVALARRWLPDAVTDGTDLEARSQMMLASHLAGLALTRSGLGLVHGIAHSISLHSGAAHGLALSSVLSAVVEYSLSAEPDGYDQVASAMSVPDAHRLPETLHTLTAQVGTAATISELGCRDDQRDSLVRTALADPVTANTPRMPDATDLDLLVGKCW